MSFLGDLFNPREGGSPVGNLLRKATGTKSAGDTVNALKGSFASLLGRGDESPQPTGASGLPNFKDILNGLIKGTKDTFVNSEAGQQAQENAVKNWFIENGYKLAFFALLLTGTIIGIVKLAKPKVRRR